MTKEEILNRLTPIIDGLRMLSNEEPITIDSNVRTDLGLESLDFVDFTLQVETTFNITISPEEASTASTVGDFITLIENKLNN